MADQEVPDPTTTPELKAIEQEIAAIKAVMTALQPLAGPTRLRVLEYVADKFQIVFKSPNEPQAKNLDRTKDEPPAHPEPRDAEQSARRVTDIRSFTEGKQPRSANEMAAVVAYYLAEVAPQGERSPTITVESATRNFKLAKHPLPRRPEQLLVNAKNAGYLDAAGDTGAYKLNPIGHNLVAHTLPRSDGAGNSRPRKKRIEKKAKAKRPVRRER